MPSVYSSGGTNYLEGTDASGALVAQGSNSWQWGMWVRFDVAGGIYRVGLSYSDFASQGLNVGFGEDADNSHLTAGIGGFATSDAGVIATGNYAGWVFISASHVGGSTEYLFRFRKEGEISLGSFTLDIGNELNFIDTIQLLSNVISEGQGVAARSFWFKDSVLGDPATMQASAVLSQPGTCLSYLALISHTTAGDNLGTGGDWTVVGTLSTDPSEPDVSFDGSLIEQFRSVEAID